MAAEAVETSEMIPHVGETPTSRAQMRALPVGSRIIGTTSGSTYVRTRDGYTVTVVGPDARRHQVGDLKNIDGMRPSAFTVASVAEEGSVTEPAPSVLPDDVMTETVVRYRTLTQYQQWFQTMIWGSAYRAGVSQQVVRDGVGQLTPAFEVTPGMAINYFDTGLLNHLPLGSVMTTGDPADGHDQFAMRGKTTDAWGSDSWTLLAGGRTPLVTHDGVITHIPGVERAPWVDEVGDLESAVAVAQFKRRAWRVGERIKASAGWCDEYEHSMARAGVTRHSETVPTWLTPEQVSALPHGALLRTEGVTVSRLYRRVDASPNPARTVNLTRSEDGHWAGLLMVVWDGTGEMRVQVTSHAEMAVMPVGTRMATHNDPAAYYEKQPEGNWRAELYNYTYTHDGFVPTEMFYVRIGEA